MSVADTAAGNPNGTKIFLDIGICTFFINGKTILINGKAIVSFNKLLLF